MRKPLTGLVLIVAVSAAVCWWLTRPQPVSASDLDGITGDPERGATLAVQAGCASCHVGPDAEDDAPLAGGRAFASKYGTIYAPNITPSEQGIGGWSEADVVSALARGTAKGGSHIYPALPYTSYENANLQDLADIAAHILAAEPDPTESKENALDFPYGIRAALGGWKLLFADRSWVIDADGDAQIERGRYLVEALYHCGQCHTPRNSLGAMDRTAWLQGAPNPSGQGTIPGITPSQLGWSDGDIAAYLTTGLDPDFDSAGGGMAAVVRNIGVLSEDDVSAIVAYMNAVPDAPVEAE